MAPPWGQLRCSLRRCRAFALPGDVMVHWWHMLRSQKVRTFSVIDSDYPWLSMVNKAINHDWPSCLINDIQWQWLTWLAYVPSGFQWFKTYIQFLNGFGSGFSAAIFGCDYSSFSNSSPAPRCHASHTNLAVGLTPDKGGILVMFTCRGSSKSFFLFFCGGPLLLAMETPSNKCKMSD